MRSAARELLAGLPDGQRDRAVHPFDDAQRRRIEYRPSPRPGVGLGELDRTGRKNAHRLLATALSPHAYAQAMAIIALEEVLDRGEGWWRFRHSNDYSVVVYGDPGGDGPWAWRFEGHHLSLTMTLDGDRVSPTPVFFGANPARTSFAGHDLLRPLGMEEDVARALLDAMDPATRAAAIVADEPPPDIRSGPHPDTAAGWEPRGVPAGRLGPVARALLDQLVAVYLARLPADLAANLAAAAGAGGGGAAGRGGGAAGELYFAWEGSLLPRAGHYYRVEGPDVLIEYDNQDDDANHAHTVLRRPGGDFGADVLAAHRAEAHHS
jgi:hypothetical protein